MLMSMGTDDAEGAFSEDMQKVLFLRKDLAILC